MDEIERDGIGEKEKEIMKREREKIANELRRRIEYLISDSERDDVHIRDSINYREISDDGPQSEMENVLDIINLVGQLFTMPGFLKITNEQCKIGGKCGEIVDITDKPDLISALLDLAYRVAFLYDCVLDPVGSIVDVYEQEVIEASKMPFNLVKKAYPSTTKGQANRMKYLLHKILAARTMHKERDKFNDPTGPTIDPTVESLNRKIKEMEKEKEKEKENTKGEQN